MSNKTSTLEQITTGITKGREAAIRILSHASEQSEASHIEQAKKQLSCLALADNSQYIKELLTCGYAGKVQLIYIDPPFFTKSKFNASVSLRTADGQTHRIRTLAFDDRFERNLECYIASMTERLMLMRELLADEGLLWVHLDWHSSHYVRIVLDEIMGEKNFVNEIIWSYKSGGSAKNHFSRKHDSILVYSKSYNYHIQIPQEKSYNRGFKPYNFKDVKEYCDDQGWYTLVNMKDVWNIDMVGRTSSERNGYATQKPLELMKRIIQASSKPGDLVADFFCGSGSFLEAAELLDRRWIGCDTEDLAFALARKRLHSAGASFHTSDMKRPPDNSSNILHKVSSLYAQGLEAAEALDASPEPRLVLLSQEALVGGRAVYKCKIENFNPDIEMGYILLNDRKYIEASLADDTLQFIDYIMIYTGENTHSCETKIIDSGFNDIALILDKCDSNDIDSVKRLGAKIVIVDIFGREYHPAVVSEIR